jgi:hypothetical protein
VPELKKSNTLFPDVKMGINYLKRQFYSNAEYQQGVVRIFIAFCLNIYFFGLFVAGFNGKDKWAVINLVVITYLVLSFCILFFIAKDYWLPRLRILAAIGIDYLAVTIILLIGERSV